MSIYHPYFRGKQYDLITVRELSPLLHTADFCPVIEPVRESLSTLQKALDAVAKCGGSAIVIVNPYHGDLSGAGEALTELLDSEFRRRNISAGILLKNDTSLREAMKCFETHKTHDPVFVHAGFTEAKALSDELGPPSEGQCHIFIEKHCGKLYQKHFKGSQRILLRDGFNRRKRNSEYPRKETFSDLHATFSDEGMDGFGDFLIVGDDYTESGGPAYAVAIHLTYIDPEKDDAMYIRHFVSASQSTPTDPAGKFAEALSEMMKILDRPKSNILETDAVNEFRMLHESGHFPGLGYVKKLSMSHHIETLANYFENL